MTKYSGYTNSGHRIFEGLDINEVYKRLPAGARQIGGIRESQEVCGVPKKKLAVLFKLMDGTKLAIAIDDSKE